MFITNHLVKIEGFCASVEFPNRNSLDFSNKVAQMEEECRVSLYFECSEPYMQMKP